MTRIRHDNIEDWIVWPQGKALILGAPSKRPTSYKLYVNCLSDTLVSIKLDNGAVYPLFTGTGQAEILFGIGGEFEILRDSENDVFFYNIGVEPTWRDVVERSYTRAHIPNARDPELELVAHKTAQNMMRLFAETSAQREKELQALKKVVADGQRVSKQGKAGVKPGTKADAKPEGDAQSGAENEGSNTPEAAADDGGNSGD